MAQLPPLEVPQGPYLVLSPHPDDETLSIGALIASLRAQDTAMTLVAATDGENAYDVSQAERIVLGETREREQTEALGILGIDPSEIKRLRLTDSGLHLREKELTERLMELAEPGMTVLAPWSGDFHPDHEACARVAATVASAKGLKLMSYLFWAWHRGTPDLLDGLSLRRFTPDAKALAAKASALEKHRSQLERIGGEPILPECLLAPARWPFEVFVVYE